MQTKEGVCVTDNNAEAALADNVKGLIDFKHSDGVCNGMVANKSLSAIHLGSLLAARIHHGHGHRHVQAG